MNLSLSPSRRWILAAVIAVGLGALALAAWWIQHLGYDFGAGYEWLLAQIRSLGPWAFFGLMAVLPAAGVPLAVFTLTAGPIFSPSLGTPWVLVLAWLSIAVNLTLTYGLARWVLRPWLERLCAWMDFKIPVVSDADQRSLVILVRVTPGPPYVLQNVLLGIAQVSFSTFFGISWLVVCAYSTAFILFGDALAKGKGRMVVVSVSLLVALSVAVRLVRRRLQRKKAEGLA